MDYGTLKEIPGEDLLDLKQLIPMPDHKCVGSKVFRHQNSAKIQKLLQDVPRGAIKVIYKNQDNTECSTSKIPVVGVQLVLPENKLSDEALRPFGKRQKDIRTITTEQEELVSRFLMEIGFAEIPDDTNRNPNDPIMARYFTFQ